MTPRSVGVTATCPICKAVIETPAGDHIVVGGKRIKAHVIDLDQARRDEVAHYEQEHPGVPIPGRWL